MDGGGADRWQRDVTSACCSSAAAPPGDATELLTADEVRGERRRGGEAQRRRSPTRPRCLRTASVRRVAALSRTVWTRLVGQKDCLPLFGSLTQPLSLSGLVVVFCRVGVIAFPLQGGLSLVGVEALLTRHHTVRSRLHFTRSFRIFEACCWFRPLSGLATHAVRVTFCRGCLLVVVSSVLTSRRATPHTLFPALWLHRSPC